MKPIRWARRGVALAGLGAAGGAAALTLRHALMTPQPLSSGLPGEGRIDREHGGEVYYTVAGPAGAQPIVLLHDLYSGASSYEYCSLFPRLAQSRRIYAPDWLGFGMSERPPLAYTGEFYASVLTGFLRDVVGQPAVVIAGGRAANIAARAASDAPALFERLTLVAPHIEAGLKLDPTLSQTLVRLAERVSLGLVPYALVSSRPALRRGASRRGLGALAEDALDHEWAAAHQFGARYAVLAALTGELDLPLQHVLPLLEPPVLIVGGELDRRRPRERMEELAALNPYAELDIIPGAGAAVAQDQPARLATTLALWLQRELARHTPTATLRVGSPEGAAVGASEQARPVSSGATTARSTGGATAILAPTEVEKPRNGAGRRGRGHREEPDDALDADELPTAKRSAVRKSASTRQQPATGPRPRSADAGSPRRDEGPVRAGGRADAAPVGGRNGGPASDAGGPKSGARRAVNPSRPHAATSPGGAKSKARSLDASVDAAGTTSSGPRHARVKPAAAGRDRSRSQTQPRAKRDSSAQAARHEAE